MNYFKITIAMAALSTSAVFGGFDLEENFFKIEKEAIDIDLNKLEISPYVGFGIGPLPVSYPTMIVGAKISLPKSLEADLRLSGVYTEWMSSSKASLGINYFIRESSSNKHYIGSGAIINFSKSKERWGEFSSVALAPRFVFGKKSHSDFGKFLTTELEMCFPYLNVKRIGPFAGGSGPISDWKWVPSFSISTSVEF